MTLDAENFRLFAMVAQWVFNVIVAIWMWWSRKHKVTTTKITEICTKMEENERDHIRIRSEINSLPTSLQFETLSRDIRKLSENLSKTSGRLEGMNRAVDLINEFLINQGKAK